MNRYPRSFLKILTPSTGWHEQYKSQDGFILSRYEQVWQVEFPNNGGFWASSDECGNLTTNQAVVWANNVLKTIPYIIIQKHY